MRMLFVPGEITTREHCYDRVEPLSKHPANPVMVADRPWAGRGVYWLCVIYSKSKGMLEMWYYVNIPGSIGMNLSP